MPAPLQEHRELARQAWFSLAKDKRTANNVRNVLKRAGVETPPSKGSINRWAVGWAKDVEKTVDVMLPKQAMMAPMPDSADLDDIPQVLQDALSPRLLHVAQGKGLERVENAVVLLSDAIASKAPQIAEMLLETETETESTITGEDGAETRKRTEKAKVAQSAVSAISVLAQAMHTIAAARTMVSVAHRNFSDGDKALAEARAIIEIGRADRAKVIPGKSKTINGLSAEEEARAALEGTLTQD